MADSQNNKTITMKGAYLYLTIELIPTVFINTLTEKLKMEK